MTRKIPFRSVEVYYRMSGIRTSPLLDPVDKIEKRLQVAGALTSDEYLVRFDTSDETFLVGILNRTMPTKLDKLKLWLIHKLYPK